MFSSKAHLDFIGGVSELYFLTKTNYMLVLFSLVEKNFFVIICTYLFVVFGFCGLNVRLRSDCISAFKSDINPAFRDFFTWSQFSLQSWQLLIEESSLVDSYY